MRTMSWLAVAAGAQGLVFDDEGRGELLSSTHPCWTRLARVSAELNLVRNALAEGVKKQLDPGGARGLTALALYREFRWLVVAVNATAAPLDATLAVPDMCAGVPLRVLSESRAVVTASSKGGPTGHALIVDRFEPYQAHVYTTLPVEGQ